MTDPVDEFEGLFRSFGRVPRWDWSNHWIRLYCTVTMLGVRRPQLGFGDERYLQEMEFDENDPILDPESRKWKERFYEGNDEWNESMAITLKSARDYIVGDRIARGIAERATQATAHYFFLEDNVANKSRKEVAFYLVDDREWITLSLPAHHRVAGRAAVSDANRLIAAVVSKISLIEQVNDHLASLVRDKNAPEHGYAYQIFITVQHPCDKTDIADLLRVNPTIPLQVISVGAGPAFNLKLNERVANRQDGKPRAARRATNTIALIPEPFRERERLRYEIHSKRQRLMSLAGSRSTEPAKKRIF